MEKILATACLLLTLSSCVKVGTSEFALSYPIDQCPRIAVRYIPVGCEHMTRTLHSIAHFETEEVEEKEEEKN